MISFFSSQISLCKLAFEALSYSKLFKIKFTKLYVTIISKCLSLGKWDYFMYTHPAISFHLQCLIFQHLFIIEFTLSKVIGSLQSDERITFLEGRDS